MGGILEAGVPVSADDNQLIVLRINIHHLPREEMNGLCRYGIPSIECQNKK